MGYTRSNYKYNGGVVNSVSEYRKRWLQHTTGCPYPKDKDADAIQRMLEEYHEEGTTDERKLQLKHDILMRCYFMFPSFLKKNYHLSSELFNDAVQNMAANTLRAIELFNPKLGFPFSNYLIGYFKDAAATALKSMYIVSAATLRRAAINASIPPEEIDDTTPFIPETTIVQTTDKDDDEVEELSITSETANAATSDLPEGGNPDDMKSWLKTNMLYRTTSATLPIPILDASEDGDSYDEDANGPVLSDASSEGPRVLRGADTVSGNVVTLDEGRAYKLAPGYEKDVDFDGHINNQQVLEWLHEGLSKEAGVLTDEERFILINHYGIDGCQPMIYGKIADIRRQLGKGYACSRISQINSGAIKKLRRFFAENGVEE